GLADERHVEGNDHACVAGYGRNEEGEQSLDDDIQNLAPRDLDDADDQPMERNVNDHQDGEGSAVPELVQGGVVRYGHNVHASQDDSHKSNEDAVVLFDLRLGFF